MEEKKVVENLTFAYNPIPPKSAFSIKTPKQYDCLYFKSRSKIHVLEILKLLAVEISASLRGYYLSSTTYK